jgi:PAS domain-containing protein
MQPVFNMAEGSLLLRKIAQASRDAFLLFDADWRITFCNAGATRLMRRAEDELVGCFLCEVAPEILANEPPAAPGSGVADGFSVERSRRQWLVQPLFNATGRIEGGFCIHQGPRSPSQAELQLR